MALHEIHWNPHTRVEGPSIDAIGPIGGMVMIGVAALREAA